MLAQSVIASDSPFPIRRLLRQSRNAKSSTEAHNRAWFAWEVSLRLAVLGGDPTLIPARRTASVGGWARALPCAGRKLETDGLRRLYLHLARVVNPDAGLRTSVQLRELVDGLVAYRNRVLGHGPSRDEDFCGAIGPTFGPGANARTDLSRVVRTAAVGAGPYRRYGSGSSRIAANGASDVADGNRGELDRGFRLPF